MSQFTAVLAGYFRATAKAIHADRFVYALVAVYLLAGGSYVLVNHGMLLGALDIYAHTCLLTYCLILPFVVLVCGIARITHRLDRRRGLAYLQMFGPTRVARFLAGTLLMMAGLLPFEAMFASVKTTFSDRGFPFDKMVADVDKFLHFGHAPVRYLYAFAKNEWVLRAVEFNYDVVWFVLCFGILYWVVISPRAEGIRLRYCVTFFLVWVIVGNIAAAMLPTAGPAFYSQVTGDPGRFEHLKVFLDGTAGWFASAADAQQYLWSLHEEGLSGFGSGISAFPSIHVALVATNAFFVLERSGWLGLLTALYTLLIMVSSVYLGWHYAVDGYAAVLLSCAIYWGIRRGLPRLQLGVERALAGASTGPIPGGEWPSQPG